MKKTLVLLAALAASTVASNAAGLRITEVMYTGLYGEFVEVTNTDASGSISLTGLAYCDNHANFTTAGKFVPLPSINLPAGHSIILTEADPTVFASVWFTLPGHAVPSTLDATVANVTINLGRADSVVIGNSLGETDRLDYNDEAVAPNLNQKGPRTEEVSAVPNVAPGTAIPTNNFSTWILSDGHNAAGASVSLPTGSATPWKSGNTAGNGTIGSPGVYIP